MRDYVDVTGQTGMEKEEQVACLKAITLDGLRHAEVMGEQFLAYLFVMTLLHLDEIAE